MELHAAEDVVFEGHPSWRGVLSFYVRAVGGALLFAVVVALIVDPTAGVVAGVVLVGAAVLAGFVKRMATVYLVTNKRLSIRRGILGRRTQQTRIDRIQNVNTRQSAVDRLVRVGTVDFDTAGTDDSEFRFVGIAAPERVVAAVDAAQREAARRATEPRFVHDPPTTLRG
jgi:uncharacterized membrane protein YdbT with pleckstrin-like domain